MAENKIEDALEKAGEILDENLSNQEQGSIKIVSGENCNDAVIKFNNEIVEFNKEYSFPLDSEIEVIVEKEHFVTYKEKFKIEATPIESTVNLSYKNYSVDIINSDAADSINVHIINENGELNSYEATEYELPYKTKLIVTATKEGYKDFEYTIDSLDEDTVIDIKLMEKVSYNLTVKSNPLDATIFINGTETHNFPLKFKENTQVNVVISKNNYITYSNDFKITEDTVLDISLEKQQYILTVGTLPINAIVTISSNGVMQQAREIQLPYASEAKIKVECLGYDTVEKTVTIWENTNELIELELSKVKLTINSQSLNDLDIFINNNKQDSNVIDLIYGDKYFLKLEKPGYPEYIQRIELTEDTIINVDELDWKKPTVSVSISNKQDIVNPITIVINDKPISDGSPVEIDYNTEAHIVVTCDGYKTIEETKLIIEDYSANYELVDINSNKVSFEAICNLEGAVVTLNGIQTNKIFIEGGNEVNVIITHVGYETINNIFTITEDTVITYDLKDFNKKKFDVTFNTNPSNAIVEINGTKVNNKKTTAEYLDMLNVIVSGTGYLTKEFNHEVIKTEIIPVKLEFDPEFGNVNEDGEVTLDKIIEMIKFRKSYSYLEISRVFKLEGYTESAIEKFYKKFGSYCVSRYDYKLWNMMHTYFGHQNIAHPNTKE